MPVMLKKGRVKSFHINEGGVYFKIHVSQMKKATGIGRERKRSLILFYIDTSCPFFALLQPAIVYLDAMLPELINNFPCHVLMLTHGI